MKVFTEEDLNQKVNIHQITVSGEYIMMIDDKRSTRRRYEKVIVEVPQGFDRSDIKNAVPRALMEHEDYGEGFKSMLTQDPDYDTVVNTQRKKKRRDLMSAAQLRKNERRLRDLKITNRNEVSERSKLGDTTYYDEGTGLPPVFND